MIRVSKILTQLSVFTLACYISEAFYIIRGFVLAVIFGPELFGVWSLMKIVLAIGANLDLGVFSALTREVPYKIGQGESQKAGDLESAAFSLSLSLTLTVALLAISYVYTNNSLTSEMQWFWTGLIAIFIATQVNNYIIAAFFAHKNFPAIGQGVLGVAVLSTVFGTISAYQYGLGGFLLALCLTYIGVAIYLVIYKAPLPKLRWNFALNRELISTGLPITLSVTLKIFLYNMDKLLIGKFMSHKDLGIYAIQYYFTIFLVLLPNLVSQVLYPHIMEYIGREQDAEGTKKYLKQPVWVLSYLVCPIIGILFLNIHLPFQWVLQKYSAAILPGQILLCASYFLVIAYMPNILLISLKRQKLVLIITVLSVLCTTAFGMYAINAGYGIVGVAIGTAASFVIYSTATMLSCMRVVRMPVRESVHFIALAVFPLLMVLLSILVLEGMIPVADGSWVSDVIYTTLKTFILVIIMFIVFYGVNKKFNLLEGSTRQA